MSWIELFLIGVGLSMDAFAVSICKGLSMKKLQWRQGLLVRHERARVGRLVSLMRRGGFFCRRLAEE